jgi:hypothetical protein
VKKLKKYTVTITREILVEAVVELEAVDESAAEQAALVDAERYPDLWKEVYLIDQSIKVRT